MALIYLRWKLENKKLQRKAKQASTFILKKHFQALVDHAKTLQRSRLQAQEYYLGKWRIALMKFRLMKVADCRNSDLADIHFQQTHFNRFKERYNSKKRMIIHKYFHILTTQYVERLKLKKSSNRLWCRNLKLGFEKWRMHMGHIRQNHELALLLSDKSIRRAALQKIMDAWKLAQWRNAEAVRFFQQKAIHSKYLAWKSIIEKVTLLGQIAIEFKENHNVHDRVMRIHYASWKDLLHQRNEMKVSLKAQQHQSLAVQFKKWKGHYQNQKKARAKRMKKDFFVWKLSASRESTLLKHVKDLSIKSISRGFEHWTSLLIYRKRVGEIIRIMKPLNRNDQISSSKLKPMIPSTLFNSRKDGFESTIKLGNDRLHRLLSHFDIQKTDLIFSSRSSTPNIEYCEKFTHDYTKKRLRNENSYVNAELRNLNRTM